MQQDGTCALAVAVSQQQAEFIDIRNCFGVLCLLQGSRNNARHRDFSRI